MSSEKNTKELVVRLDTGTIKLAGLAVLLMGWIFSLYINKWHFTVPVFMLWMGWVGVLLSVRYLWQAGTAIAVGDTATESFDVSISRARELQEEKKSLLRAIKEIEFDRDLGKMSEEDAKEMMRFYRARAIEAIKELDGLDDSSLTVEERIERDVAARMTIAKKTKSKAKKAKPVESTSSSSKAKPSQKNHRNADKKSAAESA